MTIDFGLTKSQYDLVTYISRFVDLERKGSAHVGLCPFHTEQSASFKVDSEKQTWHCFGCGKHGDIYDFVSMRTCGATVSNRETGLAAYNILTNDNPAPIYRAAVPFKTKNAHAAPTIEEVLRYHQDFDAAMVYFAARGISREMGRKHKLGLKRDGSAVYSVRTQEKDEKIYFPERRFIIPHFVGTKLINWNGRLDEDHALAETKAAAGSKIDLVIETMMWRAKLKGETLNQNMLDAETLMRNIYNPKYKQAPGGKNLVFNVSALCGRTENGDILRHESGKPKLTQGVSYCLVTEGEVDAISLESAGFTAIAGKLTHSTKDAFLYALSAVRMPIIVADNDAAGTEYANAMLNALGGRGRIIKPDGKCKDANDMVVTGTAFSWLARYGIEPKG